jgi:hypothetical protein
MTRSTVDVTIWRVVVVGPIVLVGGLIVGIVRRLLRGRTK